MVEACGARHTSIEGVLEQDGGGALGAHRAGLEEREACLHRCLGGRVGVGVVCVSHIARMYEWQRRQQQQQRREQQRVDVLKMIMALIRR